MIHDIPSPGAYTLAYPHLLTAFEETLRGRVLYRLGYIEALEPLEAKIEALGRLKREIPMAETMEEFTDTYDSLVIPSNTRE